VVTGEQERQRTQHSRAAAREGSEAVSAYLIRRLATSIVVVLGVSIFIFFLLHTIYPSTSR